MPNVAVELDVEFRDVVVEGLEISDSFGLIFQLALLRLDCSCVLLPLLRLPFNNFSGTRVGKDTTISNGLCDLVDAALGSTHSTHSNVVHGCATFVLVIDGDVLAQDVAVTDSINFIAGITILVS